MSNEKTHRPAGPAGEVMGRIGMLLVLGVLWGAPARGEDLDFRTVDLEGRPYEAGRLTGKVVLLDFWAVWCPPCIRAFPHLSRLQEELGPSGFQALGIAVHSGTYRDVREFMKKHPIKYPVTVGDEDLLERFGVIGFPTYFLIGPDGRIHEQYVGEMKDLYEVVTREVKALVRRDEEESGK